MDVEGVFNPYEFLVFKKGIREMNSGSRNLRMISLFSELPTPTSVKLSVIEVTAEFYEIYQGSEKELFIHKIHMSPKSKDIISLSTMRSRRNLSYLQFSSSPHNYPLWIDPSDGKTIHCDGIGKTIIYLTDEGKVLNILNRDEGKINSVNFEIFQKYIFQGVCPTFYKNAIMMGDDIILIGRIKNDLDGLWIYKSEERALFPTDVVFKKDCYSIGYDALVAVNIQGELSLVNIYDKSRMNYQNALCSMCKISCDGSSIIFKTEDKHKDLHYFNRMTNDHIVWQDALAGGKDEEIVLSPDGKLIAVVEYSKNNSYLTIIFTEDGNYSTFNFPKCLLTQVQFSEDNSTICFLKLPSKRAKYGYVNLFEFTDQCSLGR